MFLLISKRRRLLADSKLLGQWGEKRCEKYLRARGFKVLCRNFCCATGEVDLVAADSDGTIVFVEVKTRASESFGGPESAVTEAKRVRVGRAAKYFLSVNKIQGRRYRFDVAAIVLGLKGPVQIRYYENAFVP